VDGNLVGVLTVEKPVAWAAIFIEDARKEIIYAAIITGGISLILSLLMSAWLLRPIGRLTQYARLASEGKRAYLPRLGKAKELQDMARALQTMHKELEGKQYVEQYIQSLTHEIKSPVSAIRGAAELMNEEMSVDQRNRFLSNIAVESKRINQIVDRLLELSAVEKLQQLEESHNLQIQTELLDHAMIEGDSFLLARAIGNVLQNGIDFSPDGALVSILIDEEDSCYRLRVLDEGEGVPAFALEKVFERFFSMPRPATSKKSSGLGLAFVKEIMELHQGSVSIDNRDDAGVVVALKFPKS
jgi:two-component system sensor histidine kinase CreC